MLPWGGGAPRSTGEAGQRPWREGGAQSKLFDEGTTAAPEADQPVSPKLAELAARARKEGRLTNVVQFVDEELLRLAFGSLRKQGRRRSFVTNHASRSALAVHPIVAAS